MPPLVSNPLYIETIWNSGKYPVIQAGAVADPALKELYNAMQKSMVLLYYTKGIGQYQKNRN
jgi:hypothetical protein